MIVKKYRAKERLPVALRSSETEFEEIRLGSESVIPIAKTGGGAVQRRKVECNLNFHQVCPDSRVHFIFTMVDTGRNQSMYWRTSL